MQSSRYPSSPAARFRLHSERIALGIQEEGLILRPYASSSLPYFERLSNSEQNDVLANIANYDAICSEVRKNGNSLKDNKVMLKTALQKFGWSIAPELYDQIQEDHIVEIYNLQHTQVFCGFRFFCYCSYTLEDLYCRKWYHLFERNEIDQDYMMKNVGHFVQQSPPQAMRLDSHPHEVRELATLECLSNTYDLEWLIPAIKDEKLAGIMTLIKCDLR